MKLTEMLGQYEELLDKKDQLAKDTKDNNAAIDKLKAEIAEMMIDEDIPSQGYGDYIYSLQNKVKYSKRGEAYLQERGLDFFEVLREQGLGELIKETVNGVEEEVYYSATSGLIPVCVMAVSAVLMLLCGVLMKVTKWKWINDYALPICMVVAMALAIPISNALGG